MKLVPITLIAWALLFGVGATQAEVRKQSPAETAAIEGSEAWKKIRTLLFAERPIEAAPTSLLQFDVPVRAEDAAIVPVAVRTQFKASPDKYIRKVWLIVDKNPSPIAASFNFTPQSGRADIETRIRVEEYTPIRAIAEMNNGDLFMAAHFIKASGGCSAPAGKDAEAALANAGKMRLKLDREVKLGEPNLVQLMVSHPNNSGLAMDQVTRLFTPPYFVRRVDVSFAGKPVMSADVDFSISENPNFRFYFVPQDEGELKAEVVDTRDRAFVGKLAVTLGSAPARSAY